MILAYPSPWTQNAFPPYYLVTGDIAVYIQDNQSVANMKKVGIPAVPFRPLAMNFITAKLDPRVEHPLANYGDDPIPEPVFDGGFPNTPYFLIGVDGDDPEDNDGFTGSADGGTL